jgi:porin
VPKGIPAVAATLAPLFALLLAALAASPAAASEPEGDGATPADGSGDEPAGDGAGDTGDDGDDAPPAGWLERDTLGGDLLGLRPRASEAGIEIEAWSITDCNRTLSGGVRPHESAQRTWIRIGGTADLESLAGWRGASFTAAFWRIAGTDATERVGSLQEVAAYESRHRDQFAECFLAWTFAGEAWTVKSGKFDPCDDFATVLVGWDHLNSGVTFPPNLLSVPVYPDPAVGASVEWNPCDRAFLRAGIFDGALQEGKRTGERGVRTLFGEPADLALLLEAGPRWDGGRVALGGWRHTGDFARFDGSVKHRASGLWIVGEHRVWGDAPEEEDGDPVPAVSVFARYTETDDSISVVHRHHVVGLRWDAPFASRPGDSVGFALQHADLTGERGAGPITGREQAVEAWYRLEAAPWLHLQPGVQFVRDPGGSRRTRDALVATLRIEIDF